MMRGKRALESLDEDIRHHIEEEIRDNIERGMQPDEARRTALLKFGNITRVKEDTRAAWIPAWIEQLIQDLRYSLRLLRRNPGFSITVILTVALGIGLNVAVFSVLNAVLLRPLSYPDSDRFLSLSTLGPGIPFDMEAVAVADFADWREQATSFQAMAAYTVGDHAVETPEGTIRAQVASVSDDFWKIVGSRPTLGHFPNPGETGSFVLSDAAFKRWFHADPGVAGKAVMVNGEQLMITGVLPPGFVFELPISWGAKSSMREIDGYTSLSVSPEARARGTRFGGGFADVVAKLKPEVSLDRAKVELDSIRKGIAVSNPDWRPNQAALRVVSTQEKLVGRARYALSLLLLAVVLVLLVACANIAGLLLARASARRREIAIRASLGAGQGRVLRQMIAESLTFAVLGATAGLLLARWALAMMTRLLPDAVPRLAEATVDGRVLLFAAGATIVTALLFGLGPAVSVWKSNMLTVLKDGARTSSAGSGGVRVCKVLVAVEIASALVLLVGSGLLLKSFWRMYAHPDGLNPERILEMKIQLYGTAYRDVVKQRGYAEELLRRASSAPGVEAATMTTPDAKASLKVEGSLPSEPGEPPRMYVFNVTSAGFAKVMGVRIVRGRWFSDTEPAPVVAINERFARQEFGPADPIGMRVHLPGRQTPEAQGLATIAAVVADMKYSKLDAEPEPELYIPYRFAPNLSRMTVMVKTVGDPLSAAPSIRKLPLEVDEGQPVYDVMTMEEAMAESTAPRRFNLLLLSIFAAAALLLALVGVYGVISFTVATRTHEIGVRMALGAGRGEVARMVLGQGLILVLAGLGIGLATALGLARVMRSLLYDVSPTDSGTFAAVVGVLTITALAACLVPALKASRIEPLIALRSD